MSKIKSLINNLIYKYKNSGVVFKASVWYVLVTVMNNAISILTHPFINRILSIEEVGVFGVYHTWSSILAIIATFNLWCGVLEVLITKNKEQSNQIVASLSILVILIWTLFFAVCFVFIDYVSAFLGLKPIYILILAITILTDAMVHFWCLQKRFFYLYRYYSFLMVALALVKAILSIGLSYYFVNDRILGRILGLCIPSFLVGVVLFILMISKADFKKITAYWKRAIKFNLPLLPHYLSSVLLASSDKVMIQHIVNEASVGLYSLTYSYSSLALIVINALGNAYTPNALSLIKEENYEELSNKTKPIVFLSVIVGCLLMFLAPEGILILGGKEYLQALDIVPILILGIFFSSFYFIFSNVEFYYEKTNLIFPITALGAGLNIALNWVFIPMWGYKMAAYTTLISYVIVSLCHYIVSVKIVGKNIYPMKDICLYVLALIIVAVASIFIYQLYFLIRYATILAFLIICILLLLRYQKRTEKVEQNIVDNIDNNIV